MPPGALRPTESECSAAVDALRIAAAVALSRPMQVGNGGVCDDNSWGRVPLGCSVQTGGDWAAHYKQSGVNCNGLSLYQLVCAFYNSSAVQ